VPAATSTKTVWTVLLGASVLGLLFWAWPTRHEREAPVRDALPQTQATTLSRRTPESTPRPVTQIPLSVFVHQGPAPIVDAEVVVAAPAGALRGS